MKNTIKINEGQLAQIVAESVKRVLSEISTNLIDRAADAAHKDMMRNWGDLKVMDKRKKQWRNFRDESTKRYTEEKNSVCPYVPESELKNMPSDTFVVMDGNGRDAIDASFTYRYSGHAGTEEQCREYVDKFYDKGANWEYLPTIMTIEEYSKYNK